MRKVFLEKGDIVVKEVAQPVLDQHSVLIGVHYSCISSGTERATLTQANMSLLHNVPSKVKKIFESVAEHGVDGTTALIKNKLKGDVSCLGYSCAGRVIAVGSKIKRFRAGDLVACAGAEYAHHADFVCVPEQLVVTVSEEKYLKAASLTTIGAIALQGIRRANIQLGERVAVIGLGLIGQLTVQLAKLAGAVVIGIDIVDERLELAQRCGAHKVFNAEYETIEQDILFFTEHYGVDAVIITAASKSNTIIQQAIDITRKKGRVIIVGDVGLSLEREPWYQKEIDVLMSCSYGPGRYDQLYEHKGQDYPFAYVRWTENRNMQAFVQLIESNDLKIDPLISHEVNIDQIGQAYKHIQQGRGLATIIHYEPYANTVDVVKKEDQTYIPAQPIQFMPATKECVRVGFIGAGGFSKIKLMPMVSKIRDAQINAIVDVDPATSLAVSRVYGAARACTYDDELFNEDIVDVVIIASPHYYHCDQTLKALQQGKAVFVEKPLVTDFDQLHRIQSFLRTYPHVPLCVDYNRSYAPFIQKIKKVIQKRSTPLIISYRMNAGFIPKEHWIQTDIGAGRIIGEACHIIDLFCFLTDAKPRSVSVESLRVSRDDLFPTDNLCAQISFDDGSVCALTYTALGNKKQGKERMEVFYDGKSIIMDDFIGLYGFGLPSWFNETVSSADKGHEALLHQFFSELKKEQFTPPISFDRLHTVAELTLLIDRLACEGGGSYDVTANTP